VFELELADPAACQAACRGIDTVVHLAADPSSRAGFYESLLDNNIKGTYNIFQAAKEEGCRRVVYASSVQVISGYPLDVQAHPESPVKPLNMYAVSKCFGEAVAHYFAMAEGLSSIAIRIGSFEGNQTWTETPTARNLSTFVSKRDLSHLIVCCIEAQNIRFAIAHGVSNNRFKRMDITSTREILGYAPQDDSFQWFNIGLRYLDRWYEESPKPASDDL
jgi:uronate dehydrogenase